MKIAILAFLAALIVGCSDPAPKVQEYLKATRFPSEACSYTMREYEGISRTMEWRFSEGMTAETRAALAKQTKEQLLVRFRKEFTEAQNALKRAPPPPKEAEAYAASLKQQFESLDKLLSNWDGVVTVLEQGGNKDALAKLKIERDGIQATGTHAMSDAEAGRKELTSKYPAPSKTP